MHKYLLPISVITFSCLAGSPSEARARCQPGQIYRLSSGDCMGKSEAIQLGIYHGGRRHRAEMSAVGERLRPTRATRQEDLESDATASIPSAPEPQLPKVTVVKVRPVSADAMLSDPVPVIDRMPDPPKPASPYGELLRFLPLGEALVASSASRR